MMTYPSGGFPPDALTGSASFAKHHAEITRISIRVAVGKFIKENNLTAVDDSIEVIDLVDVFFGNGRYQHFIFIIILNLIYFELRRGYRDS